MRILVATIIGFISFNSVSQSEIVIIDRAPNQDKTKTIRLNDNIQVYKFAPLNMLSGQIAFGYERQMTKNGSVDFELGPTISNIGFGVTNHFADPFQPSTIQNSSMGFLVAAGYRYYPLEETEALNRFYVGPVVKYRLMNSVYEDISGFVSGTRKGSRATTNFFFNFGYQTWLSKSFSLDFYMGFGIGMLRQTSWFAAQEFVNNEWHNFWVEDFQSGAVYVGNIGIKVGIGTE